MFHFWVELKDLIGAAMGNEAALQHIFDAVTVPGAARPTKLNEATIMLVVLGLIDVVMISNLLIMVIIGGYETFVSRLGPRTAPGPAGMAVARQRLGAQDQAGDGDHRHLVDPPAEDLHQRRRLHDAKCSIAQTVIHVVFLLSAMAIAYTDRIMIGTQNQSRQH